MPDFEHAGRRLFFRAQGAGPLLLILPGNTASSALHGGELEHFGRRFQAAALDFLGTGGSDRLAHWPANWWEDNARAAAALVKHLGTGPAVLVGTSGGALTALLTALRHPEAVRAVVADSTVERFPAGWLEANLAERRRRTPGQIAFWQTAHGADWEAVVAADSAFLAGFSAAGGDLFQGRLAELRCPVLFTASLSDPLLPEPGPQNLAMAAQVAGSQVWLSPAGDHPLMWSRPREWRAAVDAFLETAAG